MQPDAPLRFHSAFDDLLDSFRSVIASLTWLKASGPQAQAFFAPYPYVVELPCSATDLVLKVDKSILTSIQMEGLGEVTPIFTSTLVDFYRIVTIAVKDIVWQEPAFQAVLQRDELQFLRHIRNASAHQNRFNFGKGWEREKTISRLPVSWRGKIIDENVEGTRLYMEYFAAGDLFLLLSDVSAIAAA